jgi:hypothetical protein
MAARSFSDATIPGRPQGRPNAIEGGASSTGAGRAARARVAAQQWMSKQQARGFRDAKAPNDNGARINMNRGAAIQGRKFKAEDDSGEIESKRFWKPPAK